MAAEKVEIMEIGGWILGVACLWVIFSSPLLRWVGKVLLLLLWAVAAFGYPLFVIYMKCIPHAGAPVDYMAAFNTVLAAAPAMLLWVTVGRKALIRAFKDYRKKPPRFWEQ